MICERPHPPPNSMLEILPAREHKRAGGPISSPRSILKLRDTASLLIRAVVKHDNPHRPWVLGPFRRSKLSPEPPLSLLDPCPDELARLSQSRFPACFGDAHPQPLTVFRIVKLTIGDKRGLASGVKSRLIAYIVDLALELLRRLANELCIAGDGTNILVLNWLTLKLSTIREITCRRGLGFHISLLALPDDLPLPVGLSCLL
mmetsp:Transcript_26482/g.41964  ORF Transcript_26482/g.41964 Transcript_26482/m.41964 type:complete len:203 (-) Transcript_26482:131-739(-)